MAKTKDKQGSYWIFEMYKRNGQEESNKKQIWESSDSLKWTEACSGLSQTSKMEIFAIIVSD